jgi:hypothetical protein
MQLLSPGCERRQPAEARYRQGGGIRPRARGKDLPHDAADGDEPVAVIQRSLDAVR